MKNSKKFRKRRRRKGFGNKRFSKETSIRGTNKSRRDRCRRIIKESEFNRGSRRFKFRNNGREGKSRTMPNLGTTCTIS